MPKGITTKMLRFVELYVLYYLQNGEKPEFNNLTEVAIAASYSSRSAAEIASENLKKPIIKQLIVEKIRTATKANQASLNDIINELTAMATVSAKDFYDETGDLIPIHQLPDRVAKCITPAEYQTMYSGNGDSKIEIGRTTKIKQWDKNKALDSLIKLKQLIGEVQPDPQQPGNNIQNQNNIQFNVNIVSNENNGQKESFEDLIDVDLAGMLPVNGSGNGNGKNGENGHNG